MRKSVEEKKMKGEYPTCVSNIVSNGDLCNRILTEVFDTWNYQRIVADLVRPFFEKHSERD